MEECGQIDTGGADKEKGGQKAYQKTRHTCEEGATECAQKNYAQESALVHQWRISLSNAVSAEGLLFTGC